MFDELDALTTGMSEDAAHEMMKELERNTPDHVRRMRADFRIEIKAGVTMQPGNLSERKALKVQGVTGDISNGGFQALFPVPPRVDDVYQFQFDTEQLNLPTLLARCVRCRLVGEAAYEGGFAFFASISLPDNLSV